MPKQNNLTLGVHIILHLEPVAEDEHAQLVALPQAAQKGEAAQHLEPKWSISGRTIMARENKATIYRYPEYSVHYTALHSTVHSTQHSTKYTVHSTH